MVREIFLFGWMAYRECAFGILRARESGRRGSRGGKGGKQRRNTWSFFRKKKKEGV